jgi:hypothetical protein
MRGRKNSKRSRERVANKQSRKIYNQWKRRNVKTAHHILSQMSWHLISFLYNYPFGCESLFGCVFPPFFKKIPVASQTHTHTSLPCHEVILNKCLINIWINRTWKECFCSSSSHHYQTKQKNYY